MRQSDRVFFQALYEQYKYLLLRVAGGFVTDPQEAEDLVQTALTRLLPKVDTLRQLEEKALCTYLCYTVRNAALNQLRKDGLRQKILVRQDSTELQADPAPGPEELLCSRNVPTVSVRCWRHFPTKSALCCWINTCWGDPMRHWQKSWAASPKASV